MVIFYAILQMHLIFFQKDMANSQLIMKEIVRAAAAIRNAKALVLTAGAGMGVDSGLPDFRGPEGFWRAYPPLGDKKLRLEQMSTPHWFDSNPKFAWGFFGHRYDLYSKTKPHKGFNILQNWCKKMDDRYFIFTSNVDGHFQKSGFPEEKVVECHGSINFWQCANTSWCNDIWPVPEDVKFEVNMDKLELTSPLPMGPPGKEDKLARPNILMFGDYGWLSERTDEQEERFYHFQNALFKDDIKFAVVEIGAGEYVPTIRYLGERLVNRTRGNGTLIRINPRDTDVPSGHISLPMGGLKALELIDAELQKDQSK